MDNLIVAFSTPWVVVLCIVAALVAAYDYDRPGWTWSLVAVPGVVVLTCLTLCPLWSFLTVIWVFDMLGRVFSTRRI